MPKTTRRRITWTLGALFLLAAGLALLVGHERLREFFWLEVLESERVNWRLKAADRLVALRSGAAASRFIEISLDLEENPPEKTAASDDESTILAADPSRWVDQAVKVGSSSFETLLTEYPRRPPDHRSRIIEVFHRTELDAAHAHHVLAILGLRQSEPFWHDCAAKLHGLGPAGRPLVPGLITRLEHADPRIRLYALHGLRGIGVKTPELEKALASRLDDPDPRIRKSTIRALTELGVKTPAIVSKLEQLRDGDDEGIAELAREALESPGDSS